MFDIELIRKMFVYKYTYKKEFDMKAFKKLLQLDNELINKNKFKKWIDDNGLLEDLKEWLIKQDLEKTLPEVYVIGKTSVEEFVDFLYDYGKDLTEDSGKKIVSNFLNKEKKKNKNMFK